MSISLGFILGSLSGLLISVIYIPFFPDAAILVVAGHSRGEEVAEVGRRLPGPFTQPKRLSQVVDF